MSLHALAGHMATKGRGGDSLLVHMTPGEVQALQTLAERNGGTLTINPETGQPEANFLKKILPMVAGFALGPAGFGLMSAGMAGAAVGGITALSTGSLSRGLMAGLGAYGGASLGSSLMGAGAGTPAANAAALGVEGAATGLGSQAAMLAEQTAGFGAEGLSSLADSARVAAGAAPSKAGMLSAGFDAVTKSPETLGKFAKSNFGALAAAASPMMAADTVQTTTKRPDTGTIRNFTFDPYGQTYSDAGSYPASEYKGMAQGGIVALAAGGVSDQDVQNWFAKNTGANDAQIAAAMQQFNVAPEQIARVTGVGMPEVQQRYETAIAPQIVGQYTGGVEGPGGTTAVRGTGYLGIQNQLENAGITAQELAQNPGYKGWAQPELEQAYNVANKIQQFDTGANSAALDDKAWADFMDANKFSTTNIAQATGLSEAEVQRRYDAAKKPAVKRSVVPSVMTGNTQGPGTQGGIRDLTNIGADELFSGVSGLSGAGQVGGGTVVNPNGTITTSPRIPGIPVGGFTGMENLRDVYTERGGSLGYTNPAPKTMDEFNQRFNTQTGDSLAAYNYLMGKGANPVTQQRVGEIARPYSEAIRGIPAEEGRPNQKYIYQNGRYVENPNYVPVTYNTKGERSVGLTSAEVLKGFNALPDKTDDKAIFDWVDTNKITLAQLAKAMGVPLAEAQRRRDAAAKKKTDAAEAAKAPVGDTAANGGLMGMAAGGYAVGGGLGALAKGGVADLPDGAFVLPARITSEVGNGSTNAGAQKLHAMEQRLLGKNAQPVNLGRYSGGGNLVRGEGDGVSDSVPATIGGRQPARIADGEYIVSREAVKKLGNGSTEAGARKLYAMMDRVQKARGKTTGKNRVAANTRSEKYLPA